MQANRLLVLIRGWTNGDEFFLKPEGHVGGRFPNEFLEFVSKCNPDADLLVPAFDTKELDMSGFSLSNPYDLVSHVIDEIERALVKKTMLVSRLPALAQEHC